MAEDSDDSSSTQYKKVPTHILVQKQMQDLIALQKSRVAKLENDVRSIYMYVRVSKAANLCTCQNANFLIQTSVNMVVL